MPSALGRHAELEREPEEHGRAPQQRRRDGSPRARSTPAADRGASRCRRTCSGRCRASSVARLPMSAVQRSVAAIARCGLGEPERSTLSRRPLPAAVERVADGAVHTASTARASTQQRRASLAAARCGSTPEPSGAMSAARLASTVVAAEPLDEVAVARRRRLTSTARIARALRSRAGCASARLRRRAATRGLQSRRDAAERRDVHAVRRAPPTSRSTGRCQRAHEVIDGATSSMASRQRSSVSPLAVGVLDDGPEPGAVAVELEVPPVVVALARRRR